MLFQKKKQLPHVYDVITRDNPELVNQSALLKEDWWKIIRMYGRDECLTSKIETVNGYDKLLEMKDSFSEIKVYQNQVEKNINEIDPLEPGSVIARFFEEGVTLFSYCLAATIAVFKEFQVLKKHLENLPDYYILMQENEMVTLDKLKAKQEVIGISKKKISSGGIAQSLIIKFPS